MARPKVLTRQQIRQRWKDKNPDHHINWYYMRNYGITIDQYRNMLNAQDGVCAICKQPELRSRRALAVDHDHKTGKVRELLCSRCNVTIGALEENPEILKNMIKYIEKHQSDINQGEDPKDGD